MSKLKIGAITFNVTYTAEPIMTDNDENGVSYECWGDIEYNTQQIRIDKKVSEERQCVALLHEAIHAIDKEYETHLTEPTVACLANGIMATLKQNKWFREKLLGG